MPTTRRSTGRNAKAQPTISFQNKITKPLPRHSKKETIQIPSKAQLSPSPAAELEATDVEPEVKDEPVVATPEPQAPAQSDAEVKARKVTDAQINKYWKAIEKQRIAPRVHQEDLSQNEKILRYFDVSSHFGPCVGINRTKRWYRAERLGLNPPIEVLAVLLKGEKETGATETAHIDTILNSGIAVGA